MGRLAIAGGSGIRGEEAAAGPHPGAGTRRQVPTERGPVTVLDREDHVLLQRHGIDGHCAPHLIDHGANMLALGALGCDRVLALGSVGGLREELGVGTFLCPDDFIALHLGLSLYAGLEGGRVAGFDRSWRERVVGVWGARSDVDVRDGGVYWQTIGPRFETPAEIRLIASHADVVGMTIASECVIAGELGIRYAAVCVVDNLANGVGGAPLAREDFEAGVATNRARLLEALAGVVPELAGDDG